ncbi:hypothetical protein FNT36_12610 [Hymenobacter setariae]|uniref:Uncharacterized protein n=1 Tax=Hymenobacter setariae TaxID=2594794 RepID=A0A558BUW9_9BACT|nr:hypothetical protein [Hymenobacter setariae]TVT40317.1 hypothetical protein FNT36_12610 [Hymenobacter setariae]
MRFLLVVALFTSGGLFSSTSQAVAQTAEPRNLATDTLQPANAAYYRPVSRLGTVGGKQLYVFITSVSERGTGIEFTWRNPLTMPLPKPVFITSEQLQWARFDGHYYEPVRTANTAAHGLALRLAAGPRVEVFDVATPKKGVPIPLPAPGITSLFWTGTFSNKYNHTWYLRRSSEKTMTQIPYGKQFAPFLADYLADAPDLVAAIQAGAEGYRYEDVPALLNTYNQLPSAGTP